MTKPQEPIPPAARVESDLTCTRCGYNLRGLEITGKCPECGWAVESSLRGGLLRFAGPEYLSSLISGAFIIILANIGSLILSVFAAVFVAVFLISFGITSAAPQPPGAAPAAPVMPSVDWVESAATILSTLLAIASLVGYWQFTAPDPATEQSEQPRAARRIVRVAVIVGIGILLALVVVALAGPRAAPANPANPLALATAMQLVAAVLNIAALIAGAVHFFAMMLYIRWLASRIPDPDLIQRTRLYIWLLPVLYTVGTLCLALGPLIALILYVVLLWGLRRQVITARAQSLALAAA